MSHVLCALRLRLHKLEPGLEALHEPSQFAFACIGSDIQVSWLFKQWIRWLGFDPTVGDISLGFGVSFLFVTLLSKQTMPCAFITFFTDVSASDE